MKFFSQDGQDKFVSKLFKNKKNGIFVDVGAYDGIYFSNTAYFEKELGWTGVCVEPNPSVFKQLEINRKCLSLNYCISDDIGLLQFLSVSGYGEMLSGLIQFFDEKHHNRIDTIINEHGGGKTIVEIPSLPLKEIFTQQSLSEIDYCNIDVECCEMNVLKSIDFSKVGIKIFTIENNNKTNTVRDFLKLKGYQLIGKLGADEIYEHNSKRYGLMLQWRLDKARNYLKLLTKGIFKKIS